LPAAGKTTTVRAFCEWSFNRAGLPLRWEGEGVNEVRSAAALKQTAHDQRHK
jgi:GDP-D-mannose dehydratase